MNDFALVVDFYGAEKLGRSTIQLVQCGIKKIGSNALSLSARCVLEKWVDGEDNGGKVVSFVRVVWQIHPWVVKQNAVAVVLGVLSKNESSG